MEQLIIKISEITGADVSTVRTAVGHVLLFLRDQAPQGHINELIEKNPIVHQAVESALSTSDGGVTSILAAGQSFIGEGRWDTLALQGKLENLGLNKKQIDGLLAEVFSHANALVGADGWETVKRNHPEMASLVAAANANASARRSV